MQIQGAEEEGWCDKLHCEREIEWGISEGRNGDTPSQDSPCEGQNSKTKENGGSTSVKEVKRFRI